MQHPLWDQIANDYEKVRRIPPDNAPPRWRDLAYYAVRHRLATNAASLARVDLSSLRTAQREARRTIRSGRYLSDTVYVLEPHQLGAAKASLNKERDVLLEIDGFVVVAPRWKRVNTEHP